MSQHHPEIRSIVSSSRRRFLELAAMLGGALTACKTSEEGASAPRGLLGEPVSAYGHRSPHEKSARHVRPVKTPQQASSLTPLQDSFGILTPPSVHFERHHSGVPDIDPAQHHLMIHGMVERPLMLTMDEIRRLPSVSRVLFIECSGNSRSQWGPKTAPNVQLAQGLASCSEWTGVPLRLLLEEAGVLAGTSWVLAEGADPCHMQRSIPLDKAMDDVLLAYGQNGEAIRPEQGYPLRLVIPGWEGNTQVKWLRRLKVSDGPFMVRDETSKYTDLMPDGKARQFTFVMDAKSVITFPSGEQQLHGPGPYEISGLAWSGRGKITRVEVTADGGQTWQEAQLQAPVYSMAFTRFRLPWTWNGEEATLASRSTDETGYVQPTRDELIAARGRNSDYHNNCITLWRVSPEGGVTHVDA